MDKNLKKEFDIYCKLNEIEDIDEFIEKCAKDGLVLDKYGVAPFLPKSQIQEIPVEKEVIKEVVVEVEKEVIVEKIVTKLHNLFKEAECPEELDTTEDDNHKPV